MGIQTLRKCRKSLLSVAFICLLLCISACGSTQSAPIDAREGTAVAQINAQQLQVAAQHATPTQVKPTPTPTPTTGPTPSPSPVNTYQPTIQPFPSDNGHPLLAFYYSWYKSSTWNANTMADLPTIQYNSADTATIDRQLTWAAGAGLTGFINSWWGPGDQTDTNFALLQARAASLESRTGYHFASSLYFESDAPALGSSSVMITALRYITNHYVNSKYFFHWQGKPVLFFWDVLGAGRTLAQWSYIRSQVDPNNQMIWSAEGVDNTLLSVFDGLHLFSAGYWGVVHNDMSTVDKGLSNQISTYNTTNHSGKIWAAGVFPGFDDTHVPGRANPVYVARNNGATYNTSWQAALASSPAWITITSFNEWYEGAMIEPSVTYGTQYLAITHQYAVQWHG